MATRIVDLGAVVGPQGPQGPAGVAGAPGTAGAAGKNAYQYAVEGGYSGTEAQFKAKLAKEYLPLSGGDMAGFIDMNNRVITGLPSPTAPSDAVNYQTLLNAITGITSLAILTVLGIDAHGNSVEKKYAVELQRVGTYGGDVVLYMSKTVSLSIEEIAIISEILVHFPTQFKIASNDWSDIGSYGLMLRVASAGGDTLANMGPNSTANPLVYTTNSVNLGVNNMDISGYVKVGVNA